METILFNTSPKAALLLALCALILAVVPAAFASTTYSKIESISTGWGSCASTSCAGGGGSGSYYMRRGIGSPSLDGSSTLYHISPSSQFYNALWWRHMTTNTSVSHFTMDMYQFLSNPAASQAIEYAANQYLNGWYKFSTQCSFANGVWRVWDSYNRHWVNTSAPCRRPAANTWQHLRFQYARANGRAVFVSITVNGQTYYINKSFAPQKTSGGNGDIGIHYQLDGNSSKTAYSAWIDKWSLTIW